MFNQQCSKGKKQLNLRFGAEVWGKYERYIHGKNTFYIWTSERKKGQDSCKKNKSWWWKSSNLGIALGPVHDFSLILLNSSNR